MEITVKSASLLPRVVSFVLITLALAWQLHRFDAHALHRIDTMAPIDFANYQRHMHSHSFLVAFVFMLLTGAIYLGLLEIVAWAVKALTPKAQA